MEAQQDERQGLARLDGWAVGLVLGLVGLAVFLTLLFVGNNWPRKRAARSIMDAERMVIALLPGSTAASERSQLQHAIDCVVRAVWTDRLPKEQALPFADACYAAIKDGVLSPDEVTAISAQASALCLRGGGSPGK